MVGVIVPGGSLAYGRGRTREHADGGRARGTRPPSALVVADQAFLTLPTAAETFATEVCPASEPVTRTRSFEPRSALRAR